MSLSDEELARQLQAEEELQYQQQLRANAGQRFPQQAFQQSLEGCIGQVLEYEDETLQALALSVLPDDILEAIGARDEAEDQLARRLLGFFKNEFFTWVNNVSCGRCGGQETQAAGAGPARTEEEFSGRAHIVEVHRCNACGSETRFPRYNAPGKLLETRKGRCGEWANCFTLMTRAVGLESRFVRCWEDHVFTEFYSHHQQRWIHLDPCEDEFDKPLLYEEGWGKAWSFVVAFNRVGVADVSMRYSKDHVATRERQRRIVDPNFAQACCQRLTQHLRRSLPRDVVNLWAGRDAVEAKELHRGSSKPEAPLPGRQTGSTAWRAARGELGNAADVRSRGADAQAVTKGPSPTAVTAEASSNTPHPNAEVVETKPDDTLPPLASSTPLPGAAENENLLTPAQPGSAQAPQQALPLGKGVQMPAEGSGEGGDSQHGGRGSANMPSSIPRAPRKAMVGPSKTGGETSSSTPAAAPRLDIQNLRLTDALKVGTPEAASSIPQSKNREEGQGAGAGGVSTHATSSEQQLLPRPAKKLLDRQAFAGKVRIAFDKLRSSSDLTPNQAALQALEAVRQEFDICQ